MHKNRLSFRTETVYNLFQQGDAKAVQLSLGPGLGLTRHRAKQTALFVALSGRVHVTTSEQSFDLGPSDVVEIPPAQEHSLKAQEQSVVLMILIPKQSESV